MYQPDITEAVTRMRELKLNCAVIDRYIDPVIDRSVCRFAVSMRHSPTRKRKQRFSGLLLSWEERD